MCIFSSSLLAFEHLIYTGKTFKFHTQWVSWIFEQNFFPDPNKKQIIADMKMESFDKFACYSENKSKIETFEKSNVSTNCL